MRWLLNQRRLPELGAVDTRFRGLGRPGLAARRKTDIATTPPLEAALSPGARPWGALFCVRFGRALAGPSLLQTGGHHRGVLAYWPCATRNCPLVAKGGGLALEIGMGNFRGIQVHALVASRPPPSSIQLD